MNTAVSTRPFRSMKVLLGFSLLSALLTGCSLLPERESHLNVYANGRPSGHVWATALYPDSDQKVVGGEVVMKDDMGTIRERAVLDSRGTVIFRFPSNAGHVDIIVTAPDGMTGDDRVNRHEVYRESNCKLIPGC
ncbi:hypothetical protein [Parendozoicomonas sp. Alg238-R29]|uniref:hypothetical protein n=1 Tax=Parendozoicomonas sp. Alg238-R29 TaxID=2993446 RepID=UPI00248EE527|nr:hypothetical protein [Parendozoicomonas sp. Alg238-R29]